MQSCIEPTHSIINPVAPVLDLLRRQTEAIRLDATRLLSPGARIDPSVVRHAHGAARALRKIACAAPALARNAPQEREDTGVALASLGASVAGAERALRGVIQIVGPDDPGAPFDTGIPDDPGTVGDPGSGPAAPAAAVYETFDQYDTQTQNQATQFYDQHAAQTVDQLYQAELQGLRDHLAQLAQEAGSGAHAAGATAANNAATNLGAAVGSAVGAAVGGPLGAVIGAFVGSAVFALANAVVQRMLAAFDDLFNEIFG